MQAERSLTTRRGDTIIEVMFAITIFSMVAMITFNLMNNGIARAQVALETTMARNEIDAQAEAMRFIHNSLLAEREYSVDKQEYIDLWQEIARNAVKSADGVKLNYSDCGEAIDSASNRFVLNTRDLWSGGAPGGSIPFGNKVIKDINKATLYPRIIYNTSIDTSDGSITEGETESNTKSPNTINKVEGIWMTAVAEHKDKPADSLPPGTPAPVPTYTPPEFYDIHIRTCWYGPGESAPRTIGTVLRLYNPDLVETRKKDAP